MRKAPAERRAEIISAASRIALEEGLERITLRAVAERLGVRPGLITHYFPAAEELVIAAFQLAASREREQLHAAAGGPLARLAAFVRLVERDGEELSRLWLNAKHLARFTPALAEAVQEQERLDRERLTALIAEGCAAGAFAAEDPEAACVRIFLAVDGFGAYANNPSLIAHEAYAHFVADVAEWALGLRPGTLRALLAGS